MRTHLDILITFLVTAVLTVAMLWPISQHEPGPVWSDKAIHLFAFATLAFPLAHTGRFRLISVFIGASAFGAIIELLQPSFGRSADMQDWIADVLGVALGIAVATLYRRFRRNGI